MPKGFQPGNTLSTGRPKGSKDVKTEEWHSVGEYLTKWGAQRYLEELKAASGREYMERFEKILEYFKPKLARTTVAGDENNPIQHSITVEFVNPKLK